jgi:hypothetical protein
LKAFYNDDFEENKDSVWTGKCKQLSADIVERDC